MFLLILEGIGTNELLLILIVALVIFGPRKLPQLSRSIGKSLANFKRASDDFKQTWEKEVAREGVIKEALIGEAMIGEDRSILGEPRARTQAVLDASESEPASANASSQETVHHDPSTAPTIASTQVETPEATRPRKRDWL